MAQRVDVVVTDDFDGTPGAQSVYFGLDGVEYTVDLSTDHEKQFREFLGAYIGVGRRIGRGGSASPTRKRPKSDSAGDETVVIRAWARDNGYPVKERGRVPQSVKDAYHAAHSASALSASPAFTEPEPQA